MSNRAIPKGAFDLSSNPVLYDSVKQSLCPPPSFLLEHMLTLKDTLKFSFHKEKNAAGEYLTPFHGGHFLSPTQPHAVS